MSMSFQTAENQMKALKSLLILLPTAIALVSMLVFFIIAICFNPMIPILMILKTAVEQPPANKNQHKLDKEN